MTQNSKSKRPFAYANIHHFKSNIAAYLRDLADGKYQGVIIQRYARPVAAFVPMGECDPDRHEQAQEKERQAKALARYRRSTGDDWPFPGEIS